MADAQTEESGDSVSMVEVLEEERKLEEDANAVLGGSDDKHCTYLQGYLPRQAIYACTTCTTPEKEPAGVCLACCLECHEGHQLYELYTKRNFCCDCGNSKFGENKCKLEPGKRALNEDNHYNQNFSGLYCTCHRPYPDDEDTVEDDMIQCIICEDWYHGRHLQASVPDDHGYDEMTCFSCVERCDFLKRYTHLLVPSPAADVTVISKGETTEPVDVTGSENKGSSQENEASTTNVEAPKTSDNLKATTAVTDPTSKDQMETPEKPESVLSDPGKVETPTETSTVSGAETGEKGLSDEGKDQPPSTKTEVCTTEAESSSQAGSSKEKPECLYKSLPESASLPAGEPHSLFWKHSWRDGLCVCEECKAMYAERNVPFITDRFDTITVYEAKGRNRTDSTSSQYERGMEALGQMDRVQQVEMLHGFNDMKSGLIDYLKKFADNGKVVKEEDIREFFSDLSSRKRQRTEMSHFCK